MLSMESAIVLSNGVRMPMMGLGVFQTAQGQMGEVVRAALDAGYRAFDTAKNYGNEHALGSALRASGLPRSEYFVTTKLFIDDVKVGNAREACHDALRRLQMDYVDLYLIHWPVQGYEAAWLSLEQLYRDGYARAIGVSNCWAKHLNQLEAQQTIRPMVNQIEFHPWKQQGALSEFCHARGIAIQGYGPFMQGVLLEQPEIVAMAREYGRSPAQLILRWHLQRGVPVIPKSADPQRIRSNADLFDFALDDEHVRRLNAMERDLGSLPSPDEIT